MVANATLEAPNCSVLIGEIQTNIDNKTNENTNNEEEINSNLNIPRAIKNH